MNWDDLIRIDPELLGGTPVFKGTRVPIKALFEYLENNYSIEEFLECFPSVTNEMARRILERSETALLALPRGMRILLDECVPGIESAAVLIRWAIDAAQPTHHTRLDIP